MPPIAWLQPGPLDTRTGGFIYNRRIMAAMDQDVRLVELGGGFPLPSPAERQDAARRLADLPDGTVSVIDGLALGVMADEATAEARRVRLIGLVHHPLALETGLSAEQARAFADNERRALAQVRHVIVTSEATAASLAEYGVSSDRVDVVTPGTDPAPLQDSQDDGPIRLLCVATLTPRKGHAVLMSALAQLTDLDWVLDCYGSLDRDPSCAADVRRQIERLGLADRVHLHGERDPGDLSKAYAAAGAMVLPSYHEGYGMALAEALARGLPIVSTTAGAIPDTVPSGAGLLVPPGDSDSLAGALRKVVGDPVVRRGLSEGAAKARATLPTWPAQAARFSDILRRIAA
ncbi:MAG: glycosyltransferase family 4 protein [Pseudomonadota bacterium]